MRFRSLLVILLIFSLPAALPAQTIWYVKHNATGLNNGTSWTNAFTDLQAALNAAQPGEQVWVSAGTYLPTQPADGMSADMRHRSFVLPTGVGVYGGFAGNEPANFDLGQRDFQNNITILSGDLEQNDDDSSGVTTTPIGINSFHVVIAANITGAVLDGFTITGGVANGDNAIDVHGESIADNLGGGLAINAAAITLSNIGLLGNSAYEGGGCRMVGATATIHNGLIRKNFAVYGGGLTLYETPAVLIEKTIIDDNTAEEWGGGYYCAATSAFIHHVIVRHNTARAGGGGLIFSSTTVISNSLFADNTATANESAGDHAGGGLGFLGTEAWITNVTVTNNRATSSSLAGVWALYSSFNLRNSILAGNIGVGLVKDLRVDEHEIWNSIVGNDYHNGGAIEVGFVTGDLFRNPAAGDYSLALNSAAINAGSNNWYAVGGAPDLSAITTDLAGANRIMAGFVDLGAYECQLSPDATGILYVHSSAPAGEQGGDSWSNPVKELADALLFARPVKKNTPEVLKEIWVAGGTYQPKYKVALSDTYNQPTTDRDKAFVLASGVPVYGGFAGNPGSEGNREARNPDLYPSVLDGDIDNDNTLANNVYHVVIAANADSNTVLDGFTIQNGNADISGISVVPVDGYFIFRGHGGGLVLGAGKPLIQNIVLRNNFAHQGGGVYNSGSSAIISGVTFQTNQANANGGGFYNFQGAPLVENCIFQQNQANSGGGGWYNLADSPVISTTTFIANEAVNGGGFYNFQGTPRVQNCVFQSNHASGLGGGWLNADHSPVIRTTTFTANQAVNGAGFYVQGGMPQLDSLEFSGNMAVPTTASSDDGFGGGLFNNGQSITLTNTRFLQNNARRGGGIYNQNASAQFINLVVAGNTAETTGAGMENNVGAPLIINSRFTGNGALMGAGMYNNNGDPMLVHATTYGNRAYFGAAAYNISGTFSVRNSVLRGNESIQGGTPAEGSYSWYFTVLDGTYYGPNNGFTQPVSVNDDADLFLNPRPAAEAPTVAGDYRLAVNSWLIDKGAYSVFVAGQTPDLSHITTDLGGSPRIAGPSPDLGAYEFDETTLPVTLLYFNAAAYNERVRLSWATLMEQNNHHFEIEHSTDGNHYTLLHTVSGAGNSTTPQQYQVFHNNPAVGVNYYRLKQFDLDGRMTIHGVRMVDWNGDNTHKVHVYPNPARSAFMVSLPGLSGRVQLQLVDGAGNIVHQQTAQLTSNTSRIAVQPARALPQGMYILHITGEQFNRQLKVMIR